MGLDLSGAARAGATSRAQKSEQMGEERTRRGRADRPMQAAKQLEWGPVRTVNGGQCAPYTPFLFVSIGLNWHRRV